MEQQAKRRGAVAKARDRQTFTSLADQAYRDLEERIVTLALAPGSALSEQGLAAQLGMGRTPVREALQRLANEGLVRILPRRGVLVSDVDVKTQYELLELRRAVEGLMVRAVCRRASDAQLAGFIEIAEHMEAAARHADGRAFMRLDRQFNTLISESAGNRFAVKSIRLTRGLIRRFWYMYAEEVADLPRCAALHATLARAITERDEAAADAALGALIDYIEAFTNATLGLHRSSSAAG